MFKKIKQVKGTPMLVDVESIQAITTHSPEDMGEHNGCGSLYLKGPSGICFHISNAVALIEELLVECTDKAESNESKSK